MTFRFFLRFIFSGIVIVSIQGCSTGEMSHTRGTNIIEESDLLAIYTRDGYDEVYIVNPKGEEVAHYILTQHGDTTYSQFPADAIEIKVPLEKVVIDSEIYAGALAELGEENSIKGMFDANFVTLPSMQNKIKEGRVQDMGQSISPTAEKIVALQPDALIISYYDGMLTQGLEKLGIPVIKMYDLQESSPLGRAEWIKFLGRLTENDDKADSIFAEVKTKYNALRGIDSSSELDMINNNPKVITEMIYKGVWSVAGGKSYQADMIKDGGGNYFMKNDDSSVTLNLSPEQILAEGGDADIWLIRYFGDEESLINILASDPVYGELKAYKDKNIYFSDTSKSGLFREFPFHPEKLLEDYKIIFSGDSTSTLKYFKKLDF